MPSRRFPDPPRPPAPISAVFTNGSNLLTVGFDLKLVNGLLDVGNWFLRFNNRVYTITQVQAISENVVVSTSTVVVQAGANVVSYSPPPFDVVAIPGAGGMAALAFSNFPVTT